MLWVSYQIDVSDGRLILLCSATDKLVMDTLIIMVCPSNSWVDVSSCMEMSFSHVIMFSAFPWDRGLAPWIRFYRVSITILHTTYVAPLRSKQYSVTHRTRALSHRQGTFGVFFQLDLDFFFQRYDSSKDGNVGSTYDSVRHILS